ncbi:MAG: hypothetical protein JNJ92_05935 [Altererythrobacter sp.]|nr:hypothetical protein [Altererythrobacter sp.]
MTRRVPLLPTLVVLAAATLALLLSSCTDKAPDYRYELGVEIETPNGVRSGSSVIEVKRLLVRPGNAPAGLGVESRFRGEAVPVDLPDGRTVFALLRSTVSSDWPAFLMPSLAPRKKGESYVETLDNVLLVTEKVSVPRNWHSVTGVGPSAYPMLVTFRDINDPTTVKLLDPDHLDDEFGPGVSLKRITVRITDAPVTTDIEDRLKWLSRVADAGGGLIPMVKNRQGRYEIAPGYDPALVIVGASNFSSEIYK